MTMPAKSIPLLPAIVIVTMSLLACKPATGPQSEPPTAVERAEATPDCVLTPPGEPMVCTMEWRPVCGCDGVTYSNACTAQAAGVPDFRDGACEPGTSE
jgi:hypothetical protein